MESYLNPPRNYILIKVLFGIILLILFTIITLFFTISIDQKVSFQQGEIIAKNPSSNILTPYESEVTALWVKEGAHVLIGDTLAILKNQSNSSNLIISNQALALQKQKIKRLQQQIHNLSKTILQQEQQHRFYTDKYKLDQKNASLQLNTLQHQVYSKKQTLAMLKKQVGTNAKLLQSGSISKLKFEESKQQYLEATNEYNSTHQAMQQAQSKDALLKNDLSSNSNQLSLSILQTQNNRDALSTQLKEEEIKFQQLQEQESYQATEVARSFIIADKAGAIANLYNQKTESNFLEKGKQLLSIVPQDTVGFYAKALLPQLEIREVEKGQKVHLQMNAFSFMKYGIIKGRVSFVNKNDQNEFYALIDITEENPAISLKNGYSLKGDIIIKRTKLYAFAFDKLFKR